MELHQRCYTRDECIKTYGLFIYLDTCVQVCPSGFMVNADHGECEPCEPGDEEHCKNICEAYSEDWPINIFSLADAEQYSGCHVLNSSLIITIRNKVDEKDLERILKDLREIRGYLKIARSKYLTSLKFLRNLRIVHGRLLENDHYALIVYDNPNLRELWDPNTTFKLEHGSMYIEKNNKLCNGVLNQFKEKVVHDKSKDMVQANDQEVLCGPSTLNLGVQVLSQESFRLSWRRDQTAQTIEVLYRLAPTGRTDATVDELDTHFCYRIHWTRLLLFADSEELYYNKTHYSYTVNGLLANRQYEVLVKTFSGLDNAKDARSDVQRVRTQIDIPPPPKIGVMHKTEFSISVQLEEDGDSCPNCTEYFKFQIYEIPDNLTELELRNYCKHPAPSHDDSYGDVADPLSDTNDYDECCTRQQEAIDDRQFIAAMHTEYSCKRNRKNVHYCPVEKAKVKDSRLRLCQNLNIESASYKVQQLSPFRLYALQAQACNKFGCSLATIQYERTNNNSKGDVLETLHACRVPGIKSPAEYHVYFAEPLHPNGAILSYIVHYRIFIPHVVHLTNHMTCITRAQHAAANYRYVSFLQNAEFNQIAVRVFSLAGPVMSEWVHVAACDASEAKFAQAVHVQMGIVPLAASSHYAYIIKIFITCFTLSTCATLLWFCYKRSYWRRVSDLRRYLPLPRRNSQLFATLTTEIPMDDRQILVENYENVRYNNTVDDE